jgi:hypothetical protein
MLEIGKSYRDGWGSIFVISGLITDYPEWVWSIQGAWFRKSDGRYINFSRLKNSHFANPKRTHWDLHACKNSDPLPIERPQDRKLVKECIVCGFDIPKEVS